MNSDKVNENINKIYKLINNKKFAIEIEKSINNFSISYSEINETPDYLLESIYDTKFDEIINAIKKNINIIKTEEQAQKIAFLSPEELNPEKYQDLLKKKEIKEFKKNDIKTSDAFKCSKCKKSRCEVTQKQIRSGDEPATTFVNCLECGHTFSFNT